MRESTKFMLLVVLGLLMGVVLVVSVSCGGNSPTNVVDEFAGSGSGVTQSVAPTPAPSPSPVPVGTAPYVEFNKDPKDGSGTMFNPTNHPVTFTIEYFNATDFHKQVLLLAAKHIVDPKSSKALPPAKDVLKLTCGLTWDIQIDASTTSHLGHLIFQIQTDKCQECTWKELEPEVKYSEWGECKAVPTSTESACTHSRIKTTTIREQNTCTDEVRIKSTREETQSEPCECVCVEQWRELPPVITYGEWGECKKHDIGCAQFRSVRTVIEEQNSCTRATRVKSDTTSTESKECVCEEECKASNYGQQLPTGVIAFREAPNYNDPEVACGYYGLKGYKIEPVSTPWISTGDYPVVIIKAGSSSSCSTNENTSWFDVEKGDSLTASLCDNKGISHVIVCVCPEEE